VGVSVPGLSDGSMSMRSGIDVVPQRNSRTAPVRSTDGKPKVSTSVFAAAAAGFLIVSSISVGFGGTM
jgi:hypothetical protein